MIDRSAAGRLMERLVLSIGKEAAHATVDVLVSKFTNVELAAYASDWNNWGRQKQLAPEGDWVSWGFLTGRRFGKTLAVSHFVNQEIEAGRATRVGLAAQDEANCVALQVLGPSGLIATSSPRFRPLWEASKLELVYPNGARAIVRTPEVPGKIRGYDYDLSWLTEIQSFPVATREDAYTQFFLATSLGRRRIVWDCTPRRKHPVLLQLLANEQRDPSKHIIVRGHMSENTTLGIEYLADMERKLGGTSRGREEIAGEMIEDADGALWKQAWIDAKRVTGSPRIVRRVVSCDPSVTSGKGSDNTGIVEVGLGDDLRAYVFRDDSGKVEVSQWAEILIRRYLEDKCDLVLAETNRGGNVIAGLIRAAAKDKGLSVIVFGKHDNGHKNVKHLPGTVFIKEIYASGAKEERAIPVSTAYQRGRVSHVGTLTSLEETLTSWEPTPGADSPGEMDALVHAVADLLDLTVDVVDRSADVRGAAAMGAKLAAPSASTTSRNLAALLGSGGDRGGRI